VLGSGVFRIGSSVEFDWGAVNTVWALKKNGIDEAIMINCNPESGQEVYQSVCGFVHFDVFQILSVPSFGPDARYFPSGDHATV
jgi:hypothetical protein